MLCFFMFTKKLKKAAFYRRCKKGELEDTIDSLYGELCLKRILNGRNVMRLKMHGSYNYYVVSDGGLSGISVWMICSNCLILT